MAAQTEEKALSERASEALREKVRNIVANHAQGSMDICWALYETDRTLVRVGGQLITIWEAWGYESWNDLVGQEFDMFPTTAYNYMRVWETFYVELAGAWDVGNLPGITKMLILCSLGSELSKKNVNKWLKKAQQMTCRRLRAEVFGSEEIHYFSTPVTGRDFDVVRKSIEKGREAFGEELSRGEILARMLREWMTMQRASAKIKQRKAS